jgi:hypothetical protein
MDCAVSYRPAGSSLSQGVPLSFHIHIEYIGGSKLWFIFEFLVIPVSDTSMSRSLVSTCPIMVARFPICGSYISAEQSFVPMHDPLSNHQRKAGPGLSTISNLSSSPILGTSMLLRST